MKLPSTMMKDVRVWPEMPDLRPPDLRNVWLKNGALWRVRTPWMGPLIDGSATLMLPGAGTDGGSVPRVFWAVVGHPFILPHLAYYLLHDADYAAELRRRSVADARLYKGMTLDGHISLDERLEIYGAVREFGSGVWNKHTAETVASARRFCFDIDKDEYQAICSGRCA